jgi:hypothetical protein
VYTASYTNDKFVGYTKTGQIIVNNLSATPPKTSHLWIFADCKAKKVAWVGNSQGRGANWAEAFHPDGSPNNWASDGNPYDQWKLLCRTS